jgi:hypothetical protein
LSQFPSRRAFAHAAYTYADAHTQARTRTPKRRKPTEQRAGVRRSAEPD